MRPMLIIAFVLILSVTYAQSKKKIFSLQPYSVHLLDSAESDSLLQRLDGFLLNKNGPNEKNPFIHPEYAKADINQFELFVNAEKEGSVPDFYKPTVLTILPVIKHQQYLIKLSYLGVTPQQEPKLRLIYTLVAEKRNNNYYFYNAVNYNTRHWSKQQVGSIQYIYPNQLNITKARQMDSFNNAFAKKLSTPVIPVTYYRCDDPEQLLKMMGFDYIDIMYLSTSGGFAQSWSNKLLAGNNSELYIHELVHFYTNQLFPKNNRIINEGYATYLGGSGGWSLEETRQFAKKYLDESPNTDIGTDFISFHRVEHGIPFTYIISGLICKDVESRYGFGKIKELFKATTDDEYFKILQNITGITKQQFPAYVKGLVYAH